MMINRIRFDSETRTFFASYADGTVKRITRKADAVVLGATPKLENVRTDGPFELAVWFGNHVTFIQSADLSYLYELALSIKKRDEILYRDHVIAQLDKLARA